MINDEIMQLIKNAARDKQLELDLSGMQLTSLPPEIGLLTNLTKLNLFNNQLKFLPAETGELKNLTEINLSLNQLTSLPPEFMKLTNLTGLNLAINQLTPLPPEIVNLTNLTKLDLSENQLTILPPEIGNLINLTELSITYNQLSSLPSEIVRLANLIKLDLSRNQLKSFPPEIGKLTNLTILFLSGNQMTLLPTEISKLKNLTEFTLPYNLLTFLPPEIGNLTNLTKFNLYKNQLTYLPPEIGKLTNLTELNLSLNQLTFLPLEILNLTNLTKLSLSNNPLRIPPPEIINQGIEAIFEYLRRHPKKEHYEAKLILVGEGKVGKTCLAKRLKLNRFIEDQTTKGIDILEWKINAPTAEQEEMKLNVWDFGGQEIYHATHQFFLTKRSIYLLVWNARTSHGYENIYYWLNTIEAFGEDSPIILVMSRLNERDWDLNMKDIREKFPQIIGLYKVDSENGKGIPALIDIISRTAWNLPNMRTPWVESWFKVRERLENDGRDWIEYNDFLQICRSEGLYKKQIDILDEYLHDLGIIIHFRDRLGLRNMVILKPEWATRTFYKILDTKSVQARGGILLHSELEQIWDNTVYPEEIYPKLLELMNKFELAFEMSDKRSHLIAELLPGTEPEFFWDNINNLRFYYNYDFLPAGIMTRFIVSVHRDLESKPDGTQLCWREGAVLKRENTRALVRVKPDKRMIEVSIHGDNKRETLAIIRREFDHINNSIKKVIIKEKIPCNCSKDCLHMFEYKNLLRLEKAGFDQVICEQRAKRVQLSMLLEGYEMKEIRMKETEENVVHQTIVNNQFNPQLNPQFIQKGGDVTAKAIARAESRVNIDVKVQLPLIQYDFAELKDLLIKADPNLGSNLKEISDSLDDVSADTEKESFKKPFNKLGRFLKKLADEGSDLNKIVTGTKKGIELAQKIGETYNKFAPWLGIPSIPGLFLGK